jgi:hypothetical protein
MGHSRILFGIISLLTFLFFGMSAPEGGGQSKEKPPITIRADDIGDKVMVLGRLGHPLGEMMTVKGVWAAPKSTESWKDRLIFHVTSVNGKQLAEPAIFNVYVVDVVDRARKTVCPSAGELWEVRAYENWSLRNQPADYWKEVNMQIPSPAPQNGAQLVGVLVQSKPAAK